MFAEIFACPKNPTTATEIAAANLFAAKRDIVRSFAALHDALDDDYKQGYMIGQIWQTVSPYAPTSYYGLKKGNLYIWIPTADIKRKRNRVNGKFQYYFHDQFVFASENGKLTEREKYYNMVWEMGKMCMTRMGFGRDGRITPEEKKVVLANVFRALARHMKPEIKGETDRLYDCDFDRPSIYG